MQPITSILAVTDLSGDGHNAARRAARLAHEHGAGLTILHVLPDAAGTGLRHALRPMTSTDLRATQARASLRDIALELTGRHDVAVTVEVSTARPAEALPRAAQRADLVVVGRGRYGRLPDWLQGCTPIRLLHACGRPVLTVQAPVESPYRRGLVPVDFTASSDAAVALAARLLGVARLQLLHAINDHEIGVLRHLDIPPHVMQAHRARQRAGAVARLRRQAAQLGLDATRMGFVADHGHPVWSALRQVDARSADLIVAGTHARSPLGSLVLGSTSRRWVREAACDVLVVPPARAATAGRERLAGSPVATGGRHHEAEPDLGQAPSGLLRMP